MQGTKSPDYSPSTRSLVEKCEIFLQDAYLQSHVGVVMQDRGPAYGFAIAKWERWLQHCQLYHIPSIP